MKPPPPVTATRMLAPLIRPYPDTRASLAAPLTAHYYALTANRDTSDSGPSAVYRRHGGQHLLDLIVVHVRVHGQADMPGAHLLGDRQRGAGELGQHGLAVQGEVVDLAGQADIVGIGQLLLEPDPIRALRQL